MTLLGPQERDHAAIIRQAAPQLLVIDFRQFPGEEEWLDIAIAIAERFAILVANDSGLGHFFRTAVRPIVSRFGSTESHRWAPLAPLQRTVRALDSGGVAMQLNPLAVVLLAAQWLIAPRMSLAPIPRPKQGYATQSLPACAKNPIGQSPRSIACRETVN